MQLNATGLNQVGLNGSSGPLTWWMSATLAHNQTVTGTILYTLMKSASFAGQQGLTGNIQALLVTNGIRQVQALSGTPWALFSTTMARTQALTPILYAWMSPTTLGTVQAISAQPWALVSASFARQQAVTPALTLTFQMAATLGMSWDWVIHWTGYWWAELKMARAVVASPTMQIFPSVTMGANPVMGTIRSMTAVPYAQLVATMAMVEAFTGSFNVWLSPVATFTMTQGVTGVPRALLQTTMAVQRGVVAGMNVTILKTVTFQRQIGIVPALYTQVPLYSFTMMSSQIRCNMQILGSGKKISGKIVMDVQRPYHGEQVS